MLKLNLGSGPNVMEGFVSVDCRQFDSGTVDVLCDLGNDVWPWENDSVDEVHCSHLIEHLKRDERVHFVNELYRVLKMDAKATIITPHCFSCRAYGDLTHEWPPVSEFWYNYLDKEWRDTQAPHNDMYTCHFKHTAGCGMHPDVVNRSVEFQQFAMMYYKESIQDFMATIIKTAMP